jgi:ribonuclease HII
MSLPDLSFEQKLWSRGVRHVAGADEVGRGCFAGPVTAGCVVFPDNVKINSEVEINDSKKLDHRKRVRASTWIKKNCLACGVGNASVAEINRLGIKKAAEKAYRRAVAEVNKKLTERIEFLLIDAFYVPYLGGLPVNKRSNDIVNIFESNSKQLAIKKGDSISISIAAASIIAKVHRDEYMINLAKDEFHQMYAWQSNKGYGSLQHRNAIIEHGITSHHRKQFVETFLQNRARNRNR